jgi:HlyD family secretion protein
MSDISGMDRRVERKFWTIKKIVYSSVGTLAGIMILYNLIFGDHSSQLNVDSERISISEVTTGEFQEFIPETGTVIPLRTIFLDATEGGQVDSVFVEAGSFVNKGDPILRLANTNLLLDIMFREAELFQQSNNLRNTRLAMQQNRLRMTEQLLDLRYHLSQKKRTYEESRELLKKELIPVRTFDEAKEAFEYYTAKLELTVESARQDSVFRKTQVGQLEEGLTRMEANLDMVKQNLDNLTLRAPIDGQLTSLNAEIGQTKNRGEQLGRIDIPVGFKARVQVDQHYLSRVQVGQRATSTFDNEGIELLVEKIYPEVVNSRFEVDMRFVGSAPEGIRRGQTLRIRLDLGGSSEAILLKRGAFWQSTGGQWVYVVDETDNLAKKRDIRLGRSNSIYHEVLEGLRPGEKVVTSSYETFGEIDQLVLN